MSTVSALIKWNSLNPASDPARTDSPMRVRPLAWVCVAVLDGPSQEAADPVAGVGPVGGPLVEVSLSAGENYYFSFEVDGGWYDYVKIMGFAEFLTPDDDEDKRRFVEITAHHPTYAFIDPDKLAKFCAPHGIGIQH
ncbi:hypothetical protein GCM10022247_35440 [Allokutzneria multivorans]|uniref:Uncharacterized protein n=1 Tax=Allokutzneria multivorans TaxID=1142134 RepID=A0ABP7SDD7_9PSEU